MSSFRHSHCHKCGLIFKTASGLQRHEGMVHNPPKRPDVWYRRPIVIEEEP